MTEGREDAIERGDVKRQALGVALYPLDVDTRTRGLRPPRVEKLRDEVETRDLGSSLRRRQRRIAGAAGHVEDPHRRRHAGSLHEELAYARDLLREGRVVARRPHRALSLLEPVERCGHVFLPSLVDGSQR